MQTTVNKLPKGQVELTIEVTPEELKPYLEEAARRISIKSPISGFRPGKTPYEAVKQNIGEIKIYQEALNQVVQRTFVKALEEKKIEIISTPQIEILKMAPQNPLVYKARVDLLPQIKIGDYKTIKTKPRKVKVEPTEVEKVLNNLQKSQAKEKLVDRESQKGDKMEIDFEMFLDKILLKEAQTKNQSVILGEGHFIPGFEDNIIGLKKGETKEFPLKFPSNSPQKNLADKKVDFKVLVKSVYQIDLPDFNDEFAKTVSKFNSFEELKKQILKKLEEETQRKENQRLELAILEEIMARSEFEELPNSLIEAEKEKMIAELKQTIESQDLKFQDYLSHLKKSEEDFKKEFDPQAQKRLKTALTTRKIAELENIQVSEEEVNKETTKIMKYYPENEEIKKQIKTPGYRRFLNNVLVNRKVFDYLISRVAKN